MPTFRQNHSGATSDEHLILLWLSGRPESTQRTYRRDALKFLEITAKPMSELTVADVVVWVEALTGSIPYRVRRLISIKSLLSFAHKTGYCGFDVGSVIRIPKQKRRLHERLIERKTVISMTAAADEGRDRALLRLFYASGCRVSEAVGLNVGDLGKGVVTFFGKGGKTRTVPVNQVVIDELLALGSATDDKHTPVFRNCHGRRLGVRSVQRMVAAARTDVSGVSAHWFRHAHATHSIDQGAPLHLLQKQLGHSDISTTGIYLHVRADQGTGAYINLKDFEKAS